MSEILHKYHKYYLSRMIVLVMQFWFSIDVETKGFHETTANNVEKFWRFSARTFDIQVRDRDC